MLGNFNKQKLYNKKEKKLYNKRKRKVYNSRKGSLVIVKKKLYKAYITSTNVYYKHVAFISKLRTSIPFSNLLLINYYSLTKYYLINL